MWTIALIGFIGALIFALLLVAERAFGMKINKEVCYSGAIFCVIFTIVLSSYILLM